MTPYELEELARQTSPALMKKTAALVAVSELPGFDPFFRDRLKEDISETFGTTSNEFNEVMHSKGITKHADIGNAVYGTAVATLAAVGAAAANDVYNIAKRGLTRGTNFKRMMVQSPELAHQYDHKTIQQSFDAIHRFAPEITADPTLAAAAVGQMAGSDPAYKLNIAKQIGEIQKNQGQQLGYGGIKADFSRVRSEPHTGKKGD